MSRRHRVDAAPAQVGELLLAQGVVQSGEAQAPGQAAGALELRAAENVEQLDALEQVLQAAGRGHHDVRLAHRGDLRAGTLTWRANLNPPQAEIPAASARSPTAARISACGKRCALGSNSSASGGSALGAARAAQAAGTS